VAVFRQLGCELLRAGIGDADRVGTAAVVQGGPQIPSVASVMRGDRDVGLLDAVRVLEDIPSGLLERLP